MPSFIGAGKFLGYWNANTNSGSAADLAPPLQPLLESGGYDSSTSLTPSVGDYWQVNTAGTNSGTPIDGATTWTVNDWMVYTASDTWERLSATDTAAAVMVGSASFQGLKDALLASGSADATPAAHPAGKEITFVASNNDGKYIDGDSRLTYDSNNATLYVTGNIFLTGTLEASIFHTTTVSSSIIYESGSTKFGDTNDDMHQFTGSVYGNLGITSSLGMSASYFMGDGSRLTGIEGGGSSLGNPVYVNAASSSVPFWGAVDGSSEYGLTGSGRFNFYSGSSELQVTGNIRASSMYVANHIVHEGDTDTSLTFGNNSLSFEAGGIQSWSANASQILVNADGEPYSFEVGGVTDADTFYVNGAHNNVGIRATPTGQQEALLVSGSTMFGSASANMHRFTGSARFSNSITIGDGSSSDGIYHWDDADTNIKFEDDGINFTAGAATLLSLDQGTQDTAIIGATGTDVDFRVITSGENHALFVEGSSNKISMGYTSPTQAKLSVSGSSQFGRPDGHNDEHWFSGSVFVTDDLHVEDKIYGLNDPNTYIDLSNNDQIHTYAGGKLVSLSSTGGLTLNAFNDANLNFVVESANFSRCFHVDGGSDNVGIRCAPSGTIEALTVSGSTLFGSASANTHQFTGSIMTNSSIYFNDDLINWNDDDTKISFTDDRMRFYVGNVVMLDLTETTRDTIKLGDGSDIDTIVQTNTSDRTLWIDGGNDNVGIGCAPSGSGDTFKLSVSGSVKLGTSTSTYHAVTGALELTGNIGVNTPATDYSLSLPNIDSVAGRGMAYAWSTYSSARYKEEITPMSNPIETAKKLRGVEFTWKESGHQDFGFIAEEVGKVLPQLVSYEADGKSAIGMDYAKITSLLVECVKTQQTQLEAQGKRIKTLEKKLKS